MAMAILFLSLFFSELMVGLAAEATAKGDMDTVIGIDLGMTSSVVGVYRNGQVEIIADDQGNRIMPSWVAFTGENPLVGEAAKNQRTLDPERAIFNINRLLGRPFDKDLEKDIKLLPYKVVNNSGKPYVQVKFNNGEVKLFSPEEISAMILGKMKETAESYLGHPVKNALITVSANFTVAQRQATKDAARIAGLNVFPSIIEPIAAVIAYGLDQKEGGKNILVYDLGGSIFGVTILFVEDELIMVLAISGDPYLGEEYFLQRVVKYFIERILEKLGKDIRNDSEDLDKLQKECERATRSLNSQTSVVVRVELSGGIVFSEALTRAKFEELNADLFKKMMPLVGVALTNAKLENTDIDEIVLVGGGTKIPKVQQLLKNMFNGKEPNKGIDPEEVVAYGAAVQAGEETKGTINEKDELSHKIDSYMEKINVNETALKEAI